MARDKGRPEEILAAIVKRLIDQLPGGVTEACCYVAIDPESTPAAGPGDLTFVVSPTSGTFDEAMFEGGGNEQLTAKGGVSIRVYSPLGTDQSHKDKDSLADVQRGLMPTLRRVLAALSNWSPPTPEATEGDTDDGLTRDPLIPSGYAFGVIKKKPKLVYGEVSFKVTFDWDLSEPENQ